MKVNKLNTAAALLLAGFAVNAFASTTTGDLSVEADVTASCDLSDATLDFGNVDLANGATTNTTMSLTCTGGATASSASADDGQFSADAPSGYDYAMRYDDGDFQHYLGYNLYRDNLHTQNWATSNMNSFSFSGGVALIPFYGLIGNNQVAANLPAGHYTDTVTITVTY